MPIKEKRYARLCAKKIEQRTEEQDGKRIIVGVIPYNKRSVNLGFWDDWYEELSPGCFKKTLGDKAEVKALRNHNDTEILGNTKSGTLILEDSEEGLICRCELPNTSYANDLWESTKRKDVTTMSFGMYVVEEKYKDLDEDTVLRTILDAKLDEVSFGVTYPAYPDTNAELEGRSFKLKVSEMTENMKKDVLKLAEEIRSAEGGSGGQQSGDTGSGQSGDTSQNPETQTDNGSEEEEQRKKAEEEQAQRDREAESFLYSQAY